MVKDKQLHMHKALSFEREAVSKHFRSIQHLYSVYDPNCIKTKGAYAACRVQLGHDHSAPRGWGRMRLSPQLYMRYYVGLTA
jgi:hypothetical protein